MADEVRALPGRTDRVPDLPALRLLVGVAVHGSIGASARAAGVTQQTASERLRGMEAQTGLALLRRGARGSELTEAGAVLAEWATRLLQVAEEVETALEGLRSERGRELAVWASMTVTESLVPRWLVQLRRRQESEGLRPTTVSLQAANSRHVVQAVRDGVAHLGFVEGVHAPADVRSTAVARDELVLVAASGSPLGRRRSALSPEEVSGLALTSRERGSGSREVLDAALATHGLSAADPAVELTTATGVREAVLAGSGPAFLSRRLVERELDAGRLTVVPTRDLVLSRVFRAVWVGSKEPPAGPVRELVSLARADGRAPR